MRVAISPRILVVHELVDALVRAGFAGAEHADVEVHLKAAAAEVARWFVRCRDPRGCGRPVNYDADGVRGHCARTAQAAAKLAGDSEEHLEPQQVTVRPTYAYSGRAYPRLPAVARVAAGTRYLVTMKIPADPPGTGDAYPRISQYRRYKTAPPVVIHDWTEELVHLAAHEARHTHQFRHGLPRSEIDAEHWAHRQLARHRAGHGHGTAQEPGAWPAAGTG